MLKQGLLEALRDNLSHILLSRAIICNLNYFYLASDNPNYFTGSRAIISNLNYFAIASANLIYFNDSNNSSLAFGNTSIAFVSRAISNISLIFGIKRPTRCLIVRSRGPTSPLCH